MVKTPQQLRKSYSRRPQNQPFSIRDKPRAPRTTKLRTATQWDKNALKKPSTMAKYRYGYKNAWKCKAAKERMLKLGFKAPGQYGRNQQKGVMPSMPNQVPKAFSNEDAGWIMRHCYQSRDPHYSRSQLDAVRAMLSFLFQIQTGKHYDGTKQGQVNYPTVKDQWGSMDPNKWAQPTKSIKSVNSPEPAGLTKAFTKEWTIQCGLDFMVWIVGLLICWDWGVNGMRSTADITKIKQSDDHVNRPSEGWMSTALVGGRSKLNNRKERRDWSNYRVCLCPAGKHIPVPNGWNRPENLDPQHNPINRPWCTTCPLNAFQIIRQSLPPTDLRSYPKWLPKQQRYSDLNIAHPDTIKLAIRWLNCQGGNPDQVPFDLNGGRKSLGKWCDEFNVSYCESFQLHGDLYCTWKTYYQFGLKREHVSGIRTQSKDPRECCAALRRFARGIGRGRQMREDPKSFDMNQLGALMAATLRAMGKGKEVAAILDSHEDQKSYEA